MIRVHVTPRKALFDPSLWKTNQASLRYALLSKLRGGRVSELIPALSEGVEVRSLEDSLHEQKPCPNVGLWIGRSRFEKHNNFKPAVGPSIESCELPVDACSRCPLSMEDEEGRLEHGVPAHASWTVPELRALLMEARSAQEHPSKKEADVMKGLTKCSLPELIKMATDQGITLPAKPTRGWLLLNLRQSKSTPAETIVPFGKFKDLERLATWREMELKRRETKDLPSKSLVQDPEALAKILPPDLKELRGQNSDSSWSRVGGYTTRPRASSRRLRDDVMAVDTQDSGAEDDEITMLKTRLAVLEERKASKADVVTITGWRLHPEAHEGCYRWRRCPHQWSWCGVCAIRRGWEQHWWVWIWGWVWAPWFGDRFRGWWQVGSSGEGHCWHSPSEEIEPLYGDQDQGSCEGPQQCSDGMFSGHRQCCCWDGGWSDRWCLCGLHFVQGSDEPWSTWSRLLGVVRWKGKNFWGLWKEGERGAMPQRHQIWPRLSSTRSPSGGPRWHLQV